MALSGRDLATLVAQRLTDPTFDVHQKLQQLAL